MSNCTIFAEASFSSHAEPKKRPHFHSMKGLQGRMGRDGKKRRDGRKREASAEKNGLQGPPSSISTWGWEYQSPAELLNKVLFPFQELCTFTPNLSLPPDLNDSLHGFLVFHNPFYLICITVNWYQRFRECYIQVCEVVGLTWKRDAKLMVINFSAFNMYLFDQSSINLYGR